MMLKILFILAHFYYNDCIIFLYDVLLKIILLKNCNIFLNYVTSHNFSFLLYCSYVLSEWCHLVVVFYSKLLQQTTNLCCNQLCITCFFIYYTARNIFPLFIMFFFYQNPFVYLRIRQGNWS